MTEINLCIRGYIRNSFDSSELYNFVYALSEKYTLHIYIYTFSEKSGPSVYRPYYTNYDNSHITREIILNYFGELALYIRELKISINNYINIFGSFFDTGFFEYDDYDKINLKNISIDKYRHLFKSIFNVNNMVKNDSILCVNLRFDIFTFLYKTAWDIGLFEKYIDKPDYGKYLLLNKNIILSHIEKCIKSNMYNMFFADHFYSGCDNIFFGKKNDIYKYSYYILYETKKSIKLYSDYLNNKICYSDHVQDEHTQNCVFIPGWHELIFQMVVFNNKKTNFVDREYNALLKSYNTHMCNIHDEYFNNSSCMYIYI